MQQFYNKMVVCLYLKKYVLPFGYLSGYHTDDVTNTMVGELCDGDSFHLFV